MTGCLRPLGRLCRPRGRPSEAGFTLIELLVALTLLGLISVVLFGGLRFGTRAWEAGNLQAEQLAQVQAIQALLRRRIAQALPPQPVAAGGAEDAARRAVFSGEPDALRFLAAVPSRAGVGGIYAFDLAVIEGGAGAGAGEAGVRLEFTWRLHRADDEAEPGATPEAGLGGRRVLIDGLAGARFSYFGAPASGRAAGQIADWRDRWEAEAGLPELIAIEAEFPEGDGRAWPVLQVAPKLGVARAAR
jgi:general secretion pathway protein J